MALDPEIKKQVDDYLASILTGQQRAPSRDFVIDIGLDPDLTPVFNEFDSTPPDMQALAIQIIRLLRKIEENTRKPAP